MSKTCQEAIELMNLYLDGRLSGGQYQELSKHLESCEHCRKRMNYLRVISSELRKDRPAMPDDLHSSIMNYIAKANAPAEPRRFPVKKLRKILAVCAAALALVLITPVALGSLHAGDSTVQAGDSTVQNGDGISKIDNTGTTLGDWISNFFQNIVQSLSGGKGENFSADNKDPDSVQSGSDSTGNNTQSGSNGSNGNGDETDANQQPGSSVVDDAYTVPKLHTDERFASYIVATGVVTNLQQYFDLSSVTVYPQDGSVYICLPHNAGSSAQVYNSIRSMGLTLHVAPNGLPEIDENAPEILFLIFPK